MKAQDKKMRLNLIDHLNLSNRKTGLKIFLLGKKEEQEIAYIWKCLEKNMNTIPLTSKWDWVETWLYHYHEKVDYCFIVGVSGYNPVGVVLLTKETHRPLPIPVKAYHFGPNGEPYQDQVRMINNKILVQERFESTFISLVLEVIFQKFEVEELIFDDFEMRQAKVIYKILQKYPYSVKFRLEPTLYMDLDAIRKSNRKIEEHFGYYMRRSIRRSMNAFGNDLTNEWADTSDKASNILGELINLYQATWRKLGRSGMFASQAFRGFHQEIIHKLLKNKSVILFRVRSRKYGTIGCLYMFIQDKVAYSYQIGVNDFSHVKLNNLSNKRLKTGYIVHTQCMKECLERGIKAYNFLTGTYPYKLQLTNSTSHVVTISVRIGFKPFFRNTIMDIYNKLEEKKQSFKALSIIRQLIIR